MPKRRRTTSRVPQAVPPPAPPPPLLRDPWAWASFLAVLPLVLHSLSPFVGEPAADDYDFLHDTFLSGHGSLLDGGGSRFYWRPLARQVYFRAFGGLMLAHPAAVAAVHAAFAGLAALLLYRAFRRSWPAPWAASAATFPLLLESARVLVCWPTGFHDLGAMLFAALALHEAAHRRLWSTLPALLAALLCKEIAAPAALLIPWMPQLGPGERRLRVRWSLAVAGLVAAWAAAYWAVARHAGLLLARDFFHDPAVLATPWPARFLWACGRSALDAVNLAAPAPPWDSIGLAAFTLLAVAALLAFAARGGARGRLRSALPWLAWGLAWFLAANTALADVYPDWRPYRSSFGALGLGVACTALLGAAHPALLGGLLAVRLLAFASSPGPPRVITVKPSEAGFSLDFPKLARWQRLVGETRHLLLAASPRIPTGSRVGRHYMPRLATVAFLDDKSLQVWYRDTTLRWVTLEDAPKLPQGRLAAMVECQPRPPRQLVLLDLEAVRLLHVASAEANRGELDRAMAVLERADSLQRDRGARVFLGMIAGKRALWHAYARRHDEALREALRGLPLWPESNDLRYVLAAERYRAGNLKDAASQLDTLLAYYPQDSSARRLRRTVRAALARGGAWP